ncbi:MAG: cytochrome b/b6 domain-containing protein [Pseudomonadales bacterium]|nr:cytochrome b/b6 domain-containing protein [Pseudomonadales bacterium]
MSSASRDEVSEDHPGVAPHSLVARVFHWGFIFVFAYGLAKQVDEVEELEDRAFLVEEIVFATFFLFILVVRFIYMRTTRPTALPSDTAKTVSILARFVHLGMYLSLAMLAVTGLTIGGMFAVGSREGIVFASMLWAHEAFYWASVNLIVVHVLGALYHRRLGDGVWSAMVPMFPSPTDVDRRTARSQ